MADYQVEEEGRQSITLQCLDNRMTLIWLLQPPTLHTPINHKVSFIIMIIIHSQIYWLSSYCLCLWSRVTPESSLSIAPHSTSLYGWAPRLLSVVIQATIWYLTEHNFDTSQALSLAIKNLSSSLMNPSIQFAKCKTGSWTGVCRLASISQTPGASFLSNDGKICKIDKNPNLFIDLCQSKLKFSNVKQFLFPLLHDNLTDWSFFREL